MQHLNVHKSWKNPIKYTWNGIIFCWFKRSWLCGICYSSEIVMNSPHAWIIKNCRIYGGFKMMKIQKNTNAWGRCPYLNTFDTPEIRNCIFHKSWFRGSSPVATHIHIHTICVNHKLMSITWYGNCSSQCLQGNIIITMRIVSYLCILSIRN